MVDRIQLKSICVVGAFWIAMSGTLNVHSQERTLSRKSETCVAPANSGLDYNPCRPSTSDRVISRSEYLIQLKGFWLGQCIANWTGLVTEMDKVGGAGPHGEFYTREDWGQPDQPAIWAKGKPSDLSSTIDFVFEDADGIWGADDDTDIEYMYQHLLLTNRTSMLTGHQIREGWLKHVYSDENTPFKTAAGTPENFLWVSNQQAHDLMRKVV